MRSKQIAQMSAILMSSLVFCQIMCATWIEPLSAPLERVLQNIQRYVQQNPKDAHGHYVLARLHSLAFARGVKTKVYYYDKPSPLNFSPDNPFLVERRKELGEPDQRALNHLALSIHHYCIAVKLNPNEALYWLGLGWVLEQGIKYADKLPAPFLEKPKIVSAEDWRKEALNAYRQAFRLSIINDLGWEMFISGHLGLPSGSIAQEAGEAILRLQKGRRLSASERQELRRIENEVAKLKKKRRAVTPIIFSVHRPLPLSDLVSSHSVTFDLDGDGIKERWQWVTSKAAFLIWDGERTGRVTSGLQLFGSVTWWMFWRNGYEALAALDDDGNGWLEGKELEGIFVWHDRNSNGISDQGEVLPLERFGIIRISVKGTQQDGEVLSNPEGIQLRDGRFLPTYDWVAKPR
ncbi:hypothetical protein GG496_001942 [Candidatus Fervidibacteria bacterium JGI MDM2 JNZ-1-D12]